MLSGARGLYWGETDHHESRTLSISLNELCTLIAWKAESHNLEKSNVESIELSSPTSSPEPS
jgi:hypothetical protein